MTESPIVVIDGYSLTLPGGAKPLLREVSFSVRRGEAVAIAGESGSGKSTLLRGLAGLDGGDGVASGKMELNLRSRLGGCGYLPQDSANLLLPWFDVTENVRRIAASAIEPARPRWQSAEYIVEMLKLNPRGRVETLSGGEQRRLAIAMILALKREILLLDEPFTGLDIYSRSIAMNLIRTYRQETGVTLLFITHGLEEAVHLSERTIVIDKTPIGGVVSEIVAKETGGEEAAAKSMHFVQTAAEKKYSDQIRRALDASFLTPS